MTNEEKDSVLAGMVRERREAKATLMCVEERLRQYRRALERAVSAVIRDNNWTRDGHALTLTPASSGLVDPDSGPLSYPSAKELGETLELREQLTARIEELDRNLG